MGMGLIYVPWQCPPRRILSFLFVWLIGLFAARHVLVPGHGSPLARPSVARSLGPVKTPPPYTHYPGPYVPR